VDVCLIKLLLNLDEGLNRCFYGNRVITIAWSKFNSHPHHTCCCVLG